MKSLHNMKHHSWSAVACLVLLGMLFLSLNTTNSTFQAKTNSTIATSRIPAGMIAIWSGSLSSIPAGWSLCNGSGGTPDLTDRFPVSTGYSEEPGEALGTSTHSHVYNQIPYHDHGGLTSASGDHVHFLPQVESTGSTTNAVFNQPQNPAATTTVLTAPAGSHAHTLDFTGLASGSTEMAPNLPPYYKAAYIRSTTELDILPLGIIVLWTGVVASIPSGWALCDGTTLTPDLTSSFVLGVSNGENPGLTGGSLLHNHTYNQVPYHTHVLNASGEHEHTVQVTVNFASSTSYFPQVEHVISPTARSTAIAGSHTHTIPNDGVSSPETDDDGSFNTLPPYYEVAFIMKVLPVPIIPKGIIFMWTGTLASIPAGWHPCNGTGSTPDLANQFVRGVGPAADPGSKGGFSSHNHIYSTIPTHTHTAATDGAHVHGLTFEPSYPTTQLAEAYRDYLGSSPVTDRATNPEGDHVHSIDPEGSPVCNTEFEAVLPPYYKVVFVMSMDEPPAVTNVEILNGILTANTTVNLSQIAWTLNDPDGPEMHVTWRFYLNGVVQPQFDGLYVPHAYTNKSQVWYARVTPFDGLKYGLTVQSNNVTIINSKPVASSAAITPASPTSNDSLSLAWQYADADNDVQQQARIRWFKNNVSQPTFDNQTTISKANLVYGDKWNASVEPYDGEELGAMVWSQKVTIGNADPVITHPGDISYQVGQTGNTITWNVTDANVLGQNYSIFRNSVSILNNTWTPGVAFNISVDGLGAGSYTYLIIARDGLGAQVTDQVLVTVTALPPPPPPAAVDGPGFAMILLGSLTGIAIVVLGTRKVRHN
jgi:microcystin-dependent protein